MVSNTLFRKNVYTWLVDLKAGKLTIGQAQKKIVRNAQRLLPKRVTVSRRTRSLSLRIRTH